MTWNEAECQGRRSAKIRSEITFESVLANGCANSGDIFPAESRLIGTKRGAHVRRRGRKRRRSERASIAGGHGLAGHEVEMTRDELHRLLVPRRPLTRRSAVIQSTCRPPCCPVLMVSRVLRHWLKTYGRARPTASWDIGARSKRPSSKAAVSRQDGGAADGIARHSVSLSSSSQVMTTSLVGYRCNCDQIACEFRAAL